MTSSVAAPDLGGTGSVLAIWSLVVVVVGTALFGYSVVVTVRGRRSRRRRRRAATMPRPLPPPPASRPLALSGGQPHAGFGLPSGPLPSGPTVGGQPVGRNVGLPRPRALPSGPRPMALPAGPGQRPGYQGPPIALPAGPVAGSFGGYGPGGGYLDAGQDRPAITSGPSAASHPGGSTPSYATGGPASANYGGPQGYPSGPTYPAGPGGPSYGAGPAGPSYGAGPAGPSYAADGGDGAGQGSTTYAATTYPAAGPPAPASATTYAATTSYAADQDAPAYESDGGAEYGGSTVHLAEATERHPSVGRRESRPAKKRSNECATLRAECEQLRSIATIAAAAAARAATDAETAHDEFVAAQRAADDSRRALLAVIREAAEIGNQMAGMERVTTDDQQRLQHETTHAAFAAYRRGDITSDQLREVFKRAEGWTPEHDRLSQRATELRAEEAELTRVRDAAVLAEETAGERARSTAVSARALDEQSRNATADARGRCAAADACEQRLSRR